MTYEKPAIVEIGPALKAVQGVKKSSNHPDAGGDIATPGAYEVDE